MTENLAPVATQVAETPSVQEPSNPSTEVKTPDAQAGNGESQNTAETKPKEELVPLKRVNRMRAALGDKERQLQDAQTRIAELEKATAAAKPVDSKPSRDNFDTEDDYIDAVADWKITQKEAAKAEEAKKPTPEQIARQAAEYERVAISFKAKEAEFMKTNPNYEKAASVVNTFVGMMDTKTPAFKEFERLVFTSDQAPAVIQYLGENPIEIAKMVKMSPSEVRLSLEDIVDQLSDAPKQTAQVNGDDEPEPKAVLPTPPSALTGSTRSKKSIDQMTGRELLEKYAKG